jgi:hypothetical protein
MADPSISSNPRAETRSTSSGVPAESRGVSASMAERGERSAIEPPGGVIDRVKQSATAQLTNQKERGIDALGSVVQAVRSSTQRLRDEKHDTIAGYVDQAVDRVDAWSRRLKERDVDQLVVDVQRLARRQPAVFIGSAFAIGLVGARFLKSSRTGSDVYGSDSRRGANSGGTQTSAATRRGGLELGDDVEVAIAADAVVNPDVTFSRGALDDNIEPRSGGGRKSTSRTEKP